ncbi:ATP/GTP-binding protein [Streptomyces echinatus]|uniref:ATP/GTP-binding protein n=1 Tax=Streptomyces echinatus TaxID=67293 RepID=UPI0037BADBEA
MLRRLRGGRSPEDSSGVWRGEDWAVRRVAGAGGKAYRCPGCEQTIPSGVPHVVAWREHQGAQERRHWHRTCWNARDRGRARAKRSRTTTAAEGRS